MSREVQLEATQEPTLTREGLSRFLALNLHFFCVATGKCEKAGRKGPEFTRDGTGTPPCWMDIGCSHFSTHACWVGEVPHPKELWLTQKLLSSG